MNILFIHEVDWINKVVFDIHSLAEALSLLGHRVFAIDYENTWSKKGFFDLGDIAALIEPGLTKWEVVDCPEVNEYLDYEFKGTKGKI